MNVAPVNILKRKVTKLEEWAGYNKTFENSLHMKLDNN